MLPEAIEVMTEELAQLGNPSSLHNAGRRARRVVEESREQIAEVLNARPSEVVFTSGGTEADNLAVKGLYWARQQPARRVDRGLHVLRGAAGALAARRIRHIVFEDHNAANSDVIRLLRDTGYRIYALGWSLRGIVLAPFDGASLASGREAPNFLATIDPDAAIERCRPKGWWVLSNRLIDRCH